jgi:hypothetical protein
MPTLTREDWGEIYEALKYKLTSPAVQGHDTLSRGWREHLNEIIDEIGPDGENMTEEAEASPLNGIDWPMLMDQKETLVMIRLRFPQKGSIYQDLSGVIHLIDALQDYHEKEGK